MPQLNKEALKEEQARRSAMLNPDNVQGDDYDWATLTGEYEYEREQFMEPTPEEELAKQEKEEAARLLLEIDSLAHEVRKREQYWDLGGHDGPRPIECWIQALKAAMEEAEEIKGHQHIWNEDDYCDICGRDGRA